MNDEPFELRLVPRVSPVGESDYELVDRETFYRDIFHFTSPELNDVPRLEGGVCDDCQREPDCGTRVPPFALWQIGRLRLCHEHARGRRRASLRRAA
jgi:hypothetical protein